MFQKVSAERFILNQRCIQNLAKIVNQFQPLAISRKRSILDIWKGSECTSVKVFLGIPQISNSVKHVKPVAFIQIDVLFLIKTKSEKLTCRPGVPGRPGGPTLPYEKTKIYKNQIVGKKAEGRISKRVFQENKAPILRFGLLPYYRRNNRCRNIFRTQSNTYDGAFLLKTLNSF